jgi:integrase
MARLFKRDGIYYAWVPRIGGGTRKVSTNCTDKKAAESKAAELEREALDPAHAAANKASTADACAEFLGSRIRRGRAEGTIHHYRVKLGHVVRIMPARLAEIDASACERFIEQRLEEGAAQTTVKKEIRALGATLRHARRNGTYLRDVEAVIPELEETYKPRERFLEPLELVALVNALPRERAAHVVFIVATGARWGESVRARLALDVAGSMVLLRGTKTKASLRTVPVPPTMRGALAWALANAPGERFAPWGNVRRDLAKACEAIGIAPVTPNDLRRTFATWLRISGVTPDIIGAALGHTTSRMAELVYGRIAPADLDRLITERGPALALPPAPKPTGLLMGGDVADSGRNAAFPETSSPAGSSRKASKKASNRGAQTQNRTADTGIFNPRGIAANPDEASDSAHNWAANGLTFGARARRWFMREAA